jgi:hypothetical protein
MKLPKKILILLMGAGFIVGYLRRLALGDGYAIQALEQFKPLEFNQRYWFDAIVGDVHNFIAYTLLNLSNTSSFVFKVLWAASTSIIVGVILLMFFLAYYWLKEDK